MVSLPSRNEPPGSSWRRAAGGKPAAHLVLIPLLNVLPHPPEAGNAMLSDQYVELAELAGGFIHEIKNHLSTLGLNLQLLTEDFQDPQSQRERRALERIQRLQNECQRLVDVSNDFLRFARVQDLALTE